MRDIRIISGKDIIPDQKMVFRMLNSKEDGGMQGETARQYEAVLPRLRMHLQPKAAVLLDTVPEDMQKIMDCSRMLYVMMTLGKGAGRLCRSYFDRGEEFLGLLVSAMADASLFVFEGRVLEQIKRMGREEGFGICGRYEAPGDVPMEMQKRAYDILEAERTLGMSITSGNMLEPVKSMCLFLAVTEDPGVFCGEHDCSACRSFQCGLGKFERNAMPVLKILSRQGERTIVYKPGSRLSHVLLENKISLPRPCGGMGKCGKCRVKVVKGSLPVTLADKNCLTKEELDGGIRLACQAMLKNDNLIISAEEAVEKEAGILEGCGKNHPLPKDEPAYGVSVDLGTTTLAFSLTGLKSRTVIDTYSFMNSQQVYGADVMSRIHAANQGAGEKLKAIIQNNLRRGISEMLEKNKISFNKLKKIIISGNTAMLHLLRGYSCQGLAEAPFVPFSLEQEHLSSKEVLGTDDFFAKVILPAGCSAFIGADITAGLYACGWNEQKETALFLDLGTNGEMALGNGEEFYTASTAVGPAFEGGNITFGTAGIPGAICRGELSEGKMKVHTILDVPPIGICGTGLIEIVAELLKYGIIDATGKLENLYFDRGFPVAEKQSGEMIRVYQNDIRQLQLAKGALRAGIETLMRKMGIGYDQISRVFLAGGFGYYLDKEKAAAIGLLPAELAGVAAAVGNTSLQGGERYLSEEAAEEEGRCPAGYGEREMRRIAGRAKEISLAKEPGFKEQYLAHMSFPA